MIPVRKVHNAYLTLLKATGEQIGDGAPPADVDPARPRGWLSPAGRPSQAPTLSGGEPTVTIRLRVTSAATDGSDAEAGRARDQAQWLDDRLKAVMLTGPRPSGDGWRVTGRWREATQDMPADGAHTIHADYRILIATSASSAP